MFGIGTGELLVLLVLALLVLGPDRMPRLARDIGKTVGDLRRTSDELRHEFLNADALIDKAASIAPPAEPPPSSPAEVELSALPGGASETTVEAAAEPVAEPGVEPSAEPGVPVTQAAVAESDPDETVFDKDARLARERLDDPARAERAKAEGWTVPTDEAGTNPERWG